MSDYIDQTNNSSDEEILRMVDRSNPEVKLLAERLEASNDCLKEIYDIASDADDIGYEEAIETIIDELSGVLF